jgi:hypothetical protein
MDHARSRARFWLAAAAVAALHAIIVWLLLAKMAAPRLPPVARSIEIFWLPPQTRPAEPLTSVLPPTQRPRAPELAVPAPVEPEVPPGIAAPPEALPPEEDNAIHPPIDWDAELSRTARDRVAAQADKHYREFDFPRPPPSLEKRPTFAWSRAHTHRFEWESGAVVVHLGENCVLVFFPLPGVGCAIGHIRPNGDLFKGMK